MKSVILRTFGRGSQAAPWDNEESIREELFSIERLEQHAESLAAAQPVAARPTTGRSLAARLRDNESVLLDAYRANSLAKVGVEANREAGVERLEIVVLDDELLQRSSFPNETDAGNVDGAAADEEFTIFADVGIGQVGDEEIIVLLDRRAEKQRPRRTELKN